MKKKIVILLSVLLVVTIGFSGCGDGSQLNFIESKTAQAAALDAAQLNLNDVENIKVGLEKANGQDYYEVVFKSGGQVYEYDVDAVSGKVINSRVPEKKADSDLLTAEEAQAIALKDAGLSKAQVKFVKAELERDDGRVYYDVEFYTENKEFDYEIDAKSGAILEKDFDAENYAPAVSTSKPNRPVDNTAGKNTISADKAKEIALKQVPGATASNIREFEVDYDDGRLEYEGKIIYDKIEYEFEIDGETGAIRSWDAESVYD